MRRVIAPILLMALLLVLLPWAVGCKSAPQGFRNGAVAADHVLASEAGAEMLRDGGNAVDAAVAASFTLSVVRPYSCGIGGGGFMVIHLAPSGRGGVPTQVTINYREVSPLGVGPEYYEKHPDPTASMAGGAACGVPGTVAGLLHAQEKYGRLDRKKVLRPAIRAAERGFEADADFVKACAEVKKDFDKYPGYKTRFEFVWTRYLREGNVKIGDRIENPEQAAALKLIAEDGHAAFYTGPIAEAVVAAVVAEGGPMRLADLAVYRVAEVEPLRFEFRGRSFVTMPPPSSGGVAMAQTLGIYDALEARVGEMAGGARALELYQQYAGAVADGSLGAQNAAAFFAVAALDQMRQSQYVLHPLAEAFKHAFADRAEWLGDPAFVDVPVERLTSRDYILARAGTFDPARTLAPEMYGTRESAEARAGQEGGGTSHLCAVDKWGNAVACTETINTEFGSLLAVEGYGFTLNNEMDDFTTKRGRRNAYGLLQSDRNLPAPGKRPLSSMTPTIVLDADGKVEVVAGASGGPRIITATTQATLNVLYFRQAALQAVSEPRIHHQWSPDVLEMESALMGARSPTLEQDRPLSERMKELGHELKAATNHAVVQLITRFPDGSWDAASDPRKGGKPAGH